MEINDFLMKDIRKGLGDVLSALAQVSSKIAQLKVAHPTLEEDDFTAAHHSLDKMSELRTIGQIYFDFLSELSNLNKHALDEDALLRESLDVDIAERRASMISAALNYPSLIRELLSA